MVNFNHEPQFFAQSESTRQVAFEMFLCEGGNNGDPVLNPDGVRDEEFEMWCEKNADLLSEIEMDLEA